jgi:hypothetical protein
LTIIDRPCRVRFVQSCRMRQPLLAPLVLALLDRDFGRLLRLLVLGK